MANEANEGVEFHVKILHGSLENRKSS